MKLSGPAALPCSQEAVTSASSAAMSNRATGLIIGISVQSRLLAETEGLGGGPGIGRRDLLGRDLLDLGRQRVCREGAAPLPARLVADLADIGDEIPDHVV